MTMRFSVNQSVAAGTAAADGLYAFYAFMTAASPTGPGWVSVGESDGAAGGMGVTGLILSAANLTNANSWFVLESPDGARQILFHRDVGGVATNGESHYLYNRAADYVGGSSVALPTSASSKEVYTSTTFFAAGFFQYVADDASPYAWAFFGFSGTTLVGAATFVPLAQFQVGDLDPYICMASNGAFVTNTLDELPSTASPKCWDPSASYWAGVSGYRYNNGGTVVIPAVAPAGLGGNVLILPVFFGGLSTFSPAFLKGRSTFLQFKSTAAANKSTLNGFTSIVYGNEVFPWDGITVPS